MVYNLHREIEILKNENALKINERQAYEAQNIHRIRELETIVHTSKYQVEEANKTMHQLQEIIREKDLEIRSL